MKLLLKLYERFAVMVSHLQSPFLLAVRLYWGWQFVHSGWGILLILGLGSRLIALVLTVNMLVAYWTAAREELFSIFSDPGKFYNADPYTFLFASAMVLIFGAGLFSMDTLLANRCRAWIEKQ
jgi:putative oxidoreductase